MARYWAGDIPTGTMAMYIIHALLTPGWDCVDDLADALVHLYTNTIGGLPGQMYCRQAIQLTFAANRHVGKLSDQMEGTQHQTDQVTESITGPRRRRRGKSAQVREAGPQTDVRGSEVAKVRGEDEHTDKQPVPEQGADRLKEDLIQDTVPETDPHAHIMGLLPP